MFHGRRMELILLFITLASGKHTAGIRQRDSSGFTFRSIIETLIPGISPLLDSDMSKCEALKSMFGITYDQMLQRNATSFLDQVNLDYISETETLKYNASTAIKLNKIAKNAKNVVVFVHGFMESSDGMMVQALVPEFLKQKGIMLLALDGKKVITLEYFRSSTYARFMGELLGGVLINLIEDGHDPSKIHLIGHSLGSHIVGRAGKHVRETSGKIIGRITGLDPAGPCFSTVSTDDRLDQSDAAYVDVIHSNAGRLGIVEPIGHKDFYPNGGVSQPGCYFFICDHSRAWELLAESINSPKAFPGQEAPSPTASTSLTSGEMMAKENLFLSKNIFLSIYLKIVLPSISLMITILSYEKLIPKINTDSGGKYFMQRNVKLPLFYDNEACPRFYRTLEVLKRSTIYWLGSVRIGHHLRKDVAAKKK